MAQARVGLARMFKAKAEHGKAIENYREAVKIYALLDEPGSGALMRYELGGILGETGADEEAMAEYREGLHLAQAAQDDHLLVDLSLALGDVYSGSGRWEEARSCLEKGLSWANGPDDLLKTSRHYMEIGAAEDGSGGREGFLDRVKDYFSHKQTARSKSVSRIYDRISALYLQREDWEQAARLHRQARDMFAKAQDLPNLAKAHNNLGMALKHMKDLDGAAMEYKAALDVLGRTGDRRARGITCYNLAVAYDAMGDKEQRGKYSKMARDVFEGLGLKRELKALSELK
jgi:tetratricopeptide (TPR) repeat protein